MELKLANYAIIGSDNVIKNVAVFNADAFPDEDSVKALLETTGSLLEGDYVKKAGEPGGFRYNLPDIGGKYLPEADAFIEPFPEDHPSWVLDETNYVWVAPVPKPTDAPPVPSSITDDEELNKLIKEWWGWCWNEELVAWEYKNFAIDAVELDEATVEKIEVVTNGIARRSAE